VKCVACFLCATACPAHCIDIIGVESPWPDREKYPESFVIDELRCIFCGMCEEACPTDAIVLTPRFEMSDLRRGSLIYSKDRLLVPPEAGVGAAPDDRPNGIPADLGRVAEIKSTDDWQTGYDATYRGTVLKTQKKGLAES
jgi:NADH-quinone oxidoreductase subunit I